MCNVFSISPSQLDLEVCPYVFILWRKAIEQKARKDREDKKWDLVVAPLFRSPMSEEVSKSQSELHRELMDLLREPEEREWEREHKARKAEEELKQHGVSVVKR